MSPDILVVDDDAGIRTLLSDMLQLEGYSVRLAADGLAALDECGVALPDLMILDLAMPRLDGFGVVRELVVRKWRERIPVFVLTARAGACEQLAASTPVEECTLKPFDMDDVIEKVQRLLTTPTK
ncbi:MAG: response regulator [Dehalococcoidia bacterium]